MHFGASKVVNWRAAVFSKSVIFRRTDSPLAKRRVHYGVLESPLAGFGECTSSGSCPRKLRVPPCISDADRFAVFRGVNPCLHGSTCVLFQINMIKLKHRSFVLGKLVPIIGAVSWQSVCELQRVGFSVQRHLAHSIWNRRWP